MIPLTNLKYPNIKAYLEEKENEFRFVVEPLLHGYGFTLGNSVRRILLSSVPGAAVTKIKINDLTHEYQPIDGVVEDAIDVILNLKNLRVKILNDEDIVNIKLNKSLTGEVLAKDFTTGGKVEIVNPELFICYLSKDIDLDIEIEIHKGVGYLSADKINFVSNIDPHWILVDALFSPITNVSVNVEQVRLGDKTDFDKLEITFTSDKTISGKEAVDFALGTLNNLFLQIGSTLNLSQIYTQEQLVESDKKEVLAKDDESLNEISDSLRKILQKNNIDTKSSLLQQFEDNPDNFNDFPGITKKQITEIKNFLEKYA
jgi:DNA-directed RNA polymerase subunit alpha